VTLYAVVRVRGSINVKKTIKDTMRMLKLERVNHCVLIPKNKYYDGMLRNVKDYITWGEVENTALTEIITSRGRLVGNKKVSDEYVKSVSGYKSISALSDAITRGEIIYKNIKGIKPLFRLNPPKKGYEGIKRHYSVGGTLGYRGDKINDLLRRMI
jgi:large subunit ribosomal protein L30